VGVGVEYEGPLERNETSVPKPLAKISSNAFYGPDLSTDKWRPKESADASRLLKNNVSVRRTHLEVKA
jgi:hypothetical protein